MTVPTSALRQALACLERYASHSGTPALHDPIYALLQGEGTGHEKMLSHALVSMPAHPAVAELRLILDSHIAIEEASLATVLARHGGAIPGDDLVAEVDRRLHRQVQQIRTMGNQIDRLEEEVVRAERASNAVAALGAFALLFGVCGWLIALGFFEVHWMDTPVPSSLKSAAAGVGTPDPVEMGRKP